MRRVLSQRSSWEAELRVQADIKYEVHKSKSRKGGDISRGQIEKIYL